MKKRKVYLDHNATAPLREEALNAMMPFFKDVFGNPSSVHTFGQEAKKALEDAREKFAKLINAAKPEEIIFTGCGTESDNLAIKGVALANRDKGSHIITTEIEHHAVLYTCEYLEKQGFNVTYLPVDKTGRVNPDDVLKAITSKTILVSIMHANNETGTIEPIAEIGSIISSENKKRFEQNLPRIYFHSDAVQSAGKLPIDVQKMGLDLLSVSAHKFYGPKGVGALYVKRGTHIVPILHGGHHERNLRAGTENVAGVSGMAAALEACVSEMSSEHKRIGKLRDRLEKWVVENISDVKVNGHAEERIYSVSNISFEFIDGESLLLSLDMEGIAVSTGSACASGSLETSHVLKAMCVRPEVAQGTLRFSFGHSNTEEDVDYLIKILPTVVKRLRDISPIWKNRSKK
jgi:cysteine desulfurase